MVGAYFNEKCPGTTIDSVTKRWDGEKKGFSEMCIEACCGSWVVNTTAEAEANMLSVRIAEATQKPQSVRARPGTTSLVDGKMLNKILEKFFNILPGHRGQLLLVGACFFVYICNKFQTRAAWVVIDLVHYQYN